MNSLENRKLSEQELRGSPDRFGYEWKTYSQILPESRKQLERWLGSSSLESFQGKTVLDAGCGMGRNPFWILKAGAASLVGVDVDPQSLEAARRNLAEFANARVVEGSIYGLDRLELGTFDRVTCIGVVHHLEKPEVAVKQLWNRVAPGGEMILWCYGRTGNSLLLPIINGFRSIGSRLPIRATHVLAKGVARASWPVFKKFPWKTEYYRNLKTLSYKNFESIVFDQILPKIAHYWTREEMLALVAPLGGQARVELVQGNSWSVHVTRPAGDQRGGS